MMVPTTPSFARGGTSEREGTGRAVDVVVRFNIILDDGASSHVIRRHTRKEQSVRITTRSAVTHNTIAIDDMIHPVLVLVLVILVFLFSVVVVVYIIEAGGQGRLSKRPARANRRSGGGGGGGG